MKVVIKLISLIILSSLLHSAGDSHEDAKVDGEYIMRHIQDATTFELFNPLDYNDSNYGILTKQECYDIKKEYSKRPVVKVEIVVN